jgi:sulfatase maturation enzyme AslB (radical SAM superfamily)
MMFNCKLPWQALEINETGVSPCCNFRWQHKPKTVFDFKHSTELQSVRQQLTQGQPPPQCKKCQDQERIAGFSLRTISNQFEPNDPVNQWENVSVLTSNTCNLKCTSCTQNASYVRTKELYDMGLISTQPRHIAKRSNFEQLIDHPIKTLTLLGGEPFVDSTRELLDALVANGRSKNIELRLNSNCTMITPEWLTFLSENFKTCLIKISIDGVGPVNDYLRYPSNWSTVEANIDLILAHPKITSIITAVMSNLSLLRMYELFEWCMDKNIKDVFAYPVVEPSTMMPWLLPQSLRQTLFKKYQSMLPIQDRKERIDHSIAACVDACSRPDTGTLTLSQSLLWYKQHDQHRKQNLFDVFPELIPYDC